MKADPNAPINPYRHLNCNGQIDDQYRGLTKREYFAAIAMQGYLASFQSDSWAVHELFAKHSVRMADALIKELNHE